MWRILVTLVEILRFKQFAELTLIGRVNVKDQDFKIPHSSTDQPGMCRF